MPKSVYERGLLKPHEVSRLQYVFDEACRRRGIRPDTDEAREIALNILALHDAGMEDEQQLLDAVGFRPVARSA